MRCEMKTGYSTRDTAYAAFQGTFPLPFFSADSCAQTPGLFTFYIEKIQDNHCQNDRQAGFVPHYSALQVFKINDHMHVAGCLKPVLRGKEVLTRINEPVFHTMK